MAKIYRLEIKSRSISATAYTLTHNHKIHKIKPRRKQLLTSTRYSFHSGHEAIIYELFSTHQVETLTLVHGGEGQFSEVKVKVPLTRRYGYAVLNIYLPTLVLLIVSYVTLFIRPAIFDVRMMSALTVQLVIATLFSQVCGDAQSCNIYLYCINCYTFLSFRLESKH